MGLRFLLAPLLANSLVAYLAFIIEQAAVYNFERLFVLCIRQGCLRLHQALMSDRLDN